MMFRTWNHLAWRSAARASRHFSLSKTSAWSFTIPEVTSKNGFELSKMEVRSGCLTRSARLVKTQTHCHTYQEVFGWRNLLSKDWFLLICDCMRKLVMIVLIQGAENYLSALNVVPWMDSCMQCRCYRLCGIQSNELNVSWMHMTGHTSEGSQQSGDFMWQFQLLHPEYSMCAKTKETQMKPLECINKMSYMHRTRSGHSISLGISEYKWSNIRGGTEEYSSDWMVSSV